MPAASRLTDNAGSAGDPAPRGDLLLYLAPGTGIVAILVSWLLAIPRIRSQAEEVGAELPTFTRLLVEHAGLITTVAAIAAALGIAAITLTRRRVVRIGISLVTSLIVFGLLAWDLVVFWLIYVGMLESMSS